MIRILAALVSLLSFRVRSRACLELELIALRHQVSVLRRQHPGRLQLFATDRLLWVWLYRIWPQVLNAIVLVKPATVIQWNRNPRIGCPRIAQEIARAFGTDIDKDIVRRVLAKHYRPDAGTD